jgi:ubiquinone/menaquinone biosynthesis C-methylase UbiE
MPLPTNYILPHDLEGEQQRLALMSELLDPLHRSCIEKLGLQPGWRCLEVGCGNGSISKWLAGRVGASGLAVASDLDLQYVSGVKIPHLEIRKLNILEDPVEQNTYDLVTARAILHHLASPEKALQRMAAALKPGGVLLSIEPDMVPVTVADPETMHRFWEGWLKWSRTMGVDYFIGRKMPGMLAKSGLEAVNAEGHTALFNGGSPWADYWVRTIRELRSKLVESGNMTEALMSQFEALYSDPQYWTSAISFVASWGRKPRMPS